MTVDPRNQVPITPPPITPVEPIKTDNIFNKIADGFTGWIGSLTGHPKSKKASLKQQTPQSQQTQASQSQSSGGQPQQPNQVAEDSVTQDLQQFKKLVGKFSKNVNESVGPVVQKGIKSSSQKASAFNKANQGFIRTVLKIFFIVILIIIVAFVGMQFLKKLPGGGGGGGATPTPGESTLTVTPTPIVYNPTKPSIYAQDPVVLKLEQDIDVLTREISGTNIKETQLNPPNLDYGISF